MIKRLLAILLTLFAAATFAAVDANKATQAELESVKGIGPAISTKIIDERKKGAFKDWEDMVVRVKGVGEGNAAKFSTEGLTVNGAAFAGAPAKAVVPAAKKETKAAAKTEAPKAAAASAEAKPAAAEKKAPMSAADKKAAKMAAAEEAKMAKADKAAAKKAAKEGKPAAAATAASAAKK